MTTLADYLGWKEQSEDYDLVLVHDNGREEICNYIEEDRFLRGAQWFIARDSYVSRPTLIQAYSYEDAWEAWLDESETVPREDLIEAYGRDGESYYDLANTANPDVTLELIKEIAHEMLNADPDPELLEGYHYQSNSTGTGVVFLDYSATLNDADLSQIIIRKKERA